MGPAPPPRAALPPPALVQAEAHGAGGAAGAGAASVLLAHVPARSCSASSAHATHSPVRRESTSPRLHAQAAPATVLRTPAAAGSQTGARSAGVAVGGWRRGHHVLTGAAAEQTAPCLGPRTDMESHGASGMWSGGAASERSLLSDSRDDRGAAALTPEAPPRRGGCRSAALAQLLRPRLGAVSAAARARRPSRAAQLGCGRGLC